MQLFFTMGLRAVITTDQGKEFHNKFNAEMTRVLGIEHRMTTPYHPQANGLDERFNQTLVNSLAKFAQENRSKLDEKLPELVYTAVHDSTKHTPFEAMFDRQARLPVDFNSYFPEQQAKEFEDANEPSFSCQQAKRQKMEENVKSNIAVAQVNDFVGLKFNNIVLKL